ncbi:MAG: hypothetical protein V4562_04900 [Pseudomonadota bacterium]
MTISFQIDVEVDDQAPASRRISAYRRCKEMNPRWMLEARAGQLLPVTPPKANTDTARSAPFRAFQLPPLH